MVSSSSNPSCIVETGEWYPYPSHVSAPNLDVVKLSGRDNFDVWRTQMIYFLLNHNMLGFINGKYLRPEGGVGDMEAWIRSDALAKSWILGCLSQQAAIDVVNRLTLADYSAKDVWDELGCIYGLVVLQRASDSDQEEIPCPYNALYKFTLQGRWDRVESILQEHGLTGMEKITNNGNTTLHVAVGTISDQEMLERLMGMAPNISLLYLRNSDGSTLLHVAAIVGNTIAANILIRKNRDLLIVKDNAGYTPLAIALSNMHIQMSQCLLLHINTDIEKDALFCGTTGDELLVLAISSKDFCLAHGLQKRYRTLNSDVALIAMAQNFPCELGFWEKGTMIKPAGHKIVRRDRRPISLHYLNYGKQIHRIYLTGAFWTSLIVHSIIKMCVWPFVKKRVQIHEDAIHLLEDICLLIRSSPDSSSHHHYYTNPVFEATRQNAFEVVERIMYYFPNAIWSTNRDGHNIIQYAVINRSEKIYNMLYQMSDHKNIYRTIKDSAGNNLLHLAARLAPSEKLNLISGAALQIQHELQWFKEVERFVCPLNTTQRNSSQETPQMVFTREHKDLVIEGEKWMKSTAESYTITAALITTIVFAAAITVPGGNNQDTGVPIFTNNPAFTIFALSDAISLFTAVMSLLMFLSILTTRFAEEDFLYKLPKKLIIGLVTLFISTTTMIIAFGASLFIVFGRKNTSLLIPIGVLTCLTITFFVALQFPLVVDLMTATYGRSIFGRKRATTSTVPL